MNRTSTALLTGLCLLQSACGSEGNQATVYGSIEAEESVISFGVAGTVAEVLADEGDPISNGQVLAVLDTFDLAAEVALRQAELDAAVATFADIEGGYRAQDLASAAAMLDQARALSAQAEADLRRQQSLFEMGAISEREYQAAVTAKDVAVAQVSQASSRLSLLSEGYTEGQLGAASAKVREAAAALDLATSRLGGATLESPLDGVVVERYLNRGEYAGPATPVFDVADMDTIQLRAWIEEPLLGRVAPGVAASVTCDSWPDTAFAGMVTWISREAEFTPTQVQTEDERAMLVFEIRIDVPNPDARLLPGMPAQAVLELRPE